MHEERAQLLKLLLDSARQYEVNGDNAAAKRLRQCAVGVAGASNAALSGMAFIRLPFMELVLERITRPH